MSVEQLQDILNKATHEDFQEKQIDFVVGTKIILGYESILNAKGRAEARLQTLLKEKKIGRIQMKSLSQIEELVASKDVVKVKNGVIQIDPSHPDYDFWMEDYKSIKVNGITFYYDKSEIPFGEDVILIYIRTVANNLNAKEDDTYTVVYDETQGLYHY
ncbi:hypothetical protein [Lysinibacillus sp. FSL K6-4013]|uniref:hypothetical protein n=1 Tax=Lysinibacillus sp. FSL K6-4013 TaxID=2921504 RepID=UPI003159E730